MSSKKHDNASIDPGKPYEDNDVQIKGIIYFAVGLVGLIVVTFGLMWALLNVLKDYHQENQGQGNPMAMSEKERLPPEPRLQLAPGFGVESEKGRVNMELGQPQAEYRELRKEWDAMLEHGQRDPATGVTRMLPIDEAKEKVLTENLKAQAGPEAEGLFNTSRAYFTDASAGRLAAERRR